MSSSPEMDNTGRGRGRGRGGVHREPRFLPGQERPQGDNDGLPTYEHAEGYLPSYEEVMAGRLAPRQAPRQASESPDRDYVGFPKPCYNTFLYLSWAVFIFCSMSLCIGLLVGFSMDPEKHYLLVIFSFAIVFLIILGLYAFYKDEEVTD